MNWRQDVRREILESGGTAVGVEATVADESEKSTIIMRLAGSIPHRKYVSHAFVYPTVSTAKLM